MKWLLLSAAPALLLLRATAQEPADRCGSKAECAGQAKCQVNGKNACKCLNDKCRVKEVNCKIGGLGAKNWVCGGGKTCVGYDTNNQYENNWGDCVTVAASGGAAPDPVEETTTTPTNPVEDTDDEFEEPVASHTPWGVPLARSETGPWPLGQVVAGLTASDLTKSLRSKDPKGDGDGDGDVGILAGNHEIVPPGLDVALKFIGHGGCVDSQDRFYDFFVKNGIDDLSACHDECIKFGNIHEVVGLCLNTLYRNCVCYWRNGMHPVQLPTYPDSSNTRSNGDGPIAGVSGQQDAYCYSHCHVGDMDMGGMGCDYGSTLAPTITPGQQTGPVAPPTMPPAMGTCPAVVDADGEDGGCSQCVAGLRSCVLKEGTCDRAACTAEGFEFSGDCGFHTRCGCPVPTLLPDDTVGGCSRCISGVSGCFNRPDFCSQAACISHGMAFSTACRFHASCFPTAAPVDLTLPPGGATPGAPSPGGATPGAPSPTPPVLSFLAGGCMMSGGTCVGSLDTDVCSEADCVAKDWWYDATCSFHHACSGGVSDPNNKKCIVDGDCTVKTYCHNRANGRLKNCVCLDFKCRKEEKDCLMRKVTHSTLGILPDAVEMAKRDEYSKAAQCPAGKGCVAVDNGKREGTYKWGKCWSLDGSDGPLAGGTSVYSVPDSMVDDGY